jgi:hypothetical protein
VVDAVVFKSLNDVSSADNCQPCAVVAVLLNCIEGPEGYDKINVSPLELVKLPVVPFNAPVKVPPVSGR